MYRPTTFIQSKRLSQELAVESLTIASETFQLTGSFKFRAAYNLVASVSNKLIITASSGNFGQALSCACNMLGKKCIVVMPENSVELKIEATRYWGARIELVNTKAKSRAQRVAELAAENPHAYIASAYDDEFVIEGNASLGLEIANSDYPVDLVIAPIGGGGLCSGIIRGLSKSRRPGIELVAAEPALANDAAMSLASGKIVSLEEESWTIADGARTLSVGKLNFEILQKGLKKIVEVPDDLIKEALRKYFLYANLKVEPTAALSLAALMLEPEAYAGKNVLCVVSGGNVDPQAYKALIC